MKNILAIARLTFWEGVRMRLVLVFVIVLVFLMLRLPFLVRGDETVAGQLQTFLAYGLGAVGLLLGLATAFFSCATLTGEIKSNVMHLVVTKPVTRFQILVGKWVGINALMFLLVLLCGLTIYGFAVFLKNRPVAFERDRLAVRDVVWRARVAAKPTPPVDFEAEARQWVASQVKQGQQFASEQEAVADRKKDLIREWRTVAPGRYEIYVFDGLIPPRRPDAAIQVRYRARGVPMPMDETLAIDFAFADPETKTKMGAWHHTRDRALRVHQFLAHGQGVIKDGQAAIVAANAMPRERGIHIYFELDDWMEVLYNVGTFEENYAKTLVMIAARLAVLSAVGLFFSVFVSFPVACFCVLTFYLMCLGMPFWMEAIGANLEYELPSVDPYGTLGPAIRSIMVPVVQFIFPNFAYYSGTNMLVDGLYIPYERLAQALLHTLVYGLALLLLPGWLIFRAREMAQVQV